MRVEPLTPDHLARLSVQPAQSDWREVAKSLDFAALTRAPHMAWACVEGEEVVAAGGLLDAGGGRAQAWALISDSAGRHFTAIHRAVRRGFAVSGYRRIEAVTKANFQQGGRWVQLLGMQREGTMRAYLSNGDDAVLWARVV